MLNQIRGIHHVTSMAADANENNAFFTGTLGLRRVKKTVNFDAPDVYHLYYGDAVGTPGTVMTYFPFPGMARGVQGAGEVGATLFSVPEGALEYWRTRLSGAGAGPLRSERRFGEERLYFSGPDGDGFALVGVGEDSRPPWTGEIPAETAIRGFHGVSLRLADGAAAAELLKFMGYRETDRADGVLRLALSHGNGADIIEIETAPHAAPARQGAGSVHHVAFAVDNRDAQLEVRRALTEAGHRVTQAIDRDYFWAIYFRAPGGVLFEVATEAPGFLRDEDEEHLGEALKLPGQHSHLRQRLEKSLTPIRD